MEPSQFFNILFTTTSTSSLSTYVTVTLQFLVDGLTKDECLRRWLENRAIAESQHGGTPHLLTPAQTRTARAMWSETDGEEWAAQLRAKVDATRAADEARRPSVRVEVDE